MGRFKAERKNERRRKEEGRILRHNGNKARPPGLPQYEKPSKQDLSPKGPGRNDPCPCGSGVKSKKCEHGDRVVPKPSATRANMVLSKDGKPALKLEWNDANGNKHGETLEL